jgi:BlaI family transcriptional regulator, penicillinase repressor
MPKSETPRPTEAELQILGVLWRRGPSNVRQVHDALGGRTVYTSVLKLLQIMTEKGLVTREVSGRLHVYRPAHRQALVQRRLVTDLMNKAFGGSARKLLAAALSSRKSSPQELQEIRDLLAQYKKGGDS